MVVDGYLKGGRYPDSYTELLILSDPSTMGSGIKNNIHQMKTHKRVHRVHLW